MLDQKEYFEYEVEDFVENSRFIHWVLNPTPEEDLFWEQIGKGNPFLIPKINRAKNLVFLLGSNEVGLSETHKKLIFERILISFVNRRNFRKLILLTSRRVAIFVALLALSFLSYWLVTDSYNYALDADQLTSIKIVFPSGKETFVATNNPTLTQTKFGSFLIGSDTLKISGNEERLS